MLPAGIEPTSTVPKTGTLSVELREQYLMLTRTFYLWNLPRLMVLSSKTMVWAPAQLRALLGTHCFRRSIPYAKARFCITRTNFAEPNSVRVPGIEPESRPWQGRVLPLNHTRNNLIIYII